MVQLVAQIYSRCTSGCRRLIDCCEWLRGVALGLCWLAGYRPLLASISGFPYPLPSLVASGLFAGLILVLVTRGKPGFRILWTNLSRRGALATFAIASAIQPMWCENCLTLLATTFPNLPLQLAVFLVGVPWMVVGLNATWQITVASEEPEWQRVCQVALGLALGGFVLAPWGGCRWLWGMVLVGELLREIVRRTSPQAVQNVPNESELNDRTEQARPWFPTENLVVPIAVSFCCGLAFSSMLRMLGELTPETTLFFDVGFLSVWLGIGLGLYLFPKNHLFPNNRDSVSLRKSSTTGEVIVLGSIVWIALFNGVWPWFLTTHLWLASHVVWPTGLFAVRSLMEVVALIPFGILVASLSTQRNPRFWIIVGCGWFSGSVGYYLGVANSIPIAALPWAASAGLAWFCFAPRILPQFQGIREPGRGLRRMVPLAIMLFALISGGVSLNCFRPEESAKLLFSTRMTTSHRLGTERAVLRQLEGSRLLSMQQGVQRTLTLWKHRGAELFIRDNGIPRAPISADERIYPASSAESLAAAIPFLLADAPRNMALLGLNGGAMLRSFQAFPIPEIAVVEGDSDRWRMWEREFAETADHHVVDDPRVSIERSPPEWMLRTGKQHFDLIVSHPTPSLLAESAAQFQQCFYRQVARRLSDQGIFCQRVFAVDYGPMPVATTIKTVQKSFAETALFATGQGEFLLVATNRPEGLLPARLLEQIDSPQILRIFARLGWDWTLLVGLPAFDHHALQEFVNDCHAGTNNLGSLQSSYQNPLETMRWGPKLQETLELLGARRKSRPVYPRAMADESPRKLLAMSRGNRLIDWTNENSRKSTVERRFQEVIRQQKLVMEHPDAYGWEYRKILKEQLLAAGNETIRQTAGLQEDIVEINRETEHRQNYLMALGHALKERPITVANIDAVAQFCEPYDPLIVPFIHHELAELYRKASSPRQSLEHRLHLAYFAPAHDLSVRYVSLAVDAVCEQSAELDPLEVWDHLNGLLGLLQTRWELKTQVPEKSNRKQLNDIQISLRSADRALLVLEQAYVAAGISSTDWTHRRSAIETGLNKPLSTWQTELIRTIRSNEAKTRKLIQDHEEKTRESTTQEDDRPKIVPGASRELEDWLPPNSGADSLLPLTR